MLLLLITLLVYPILPPASLLSEATVFDAPTRHVRGTSPDAMAALREGYRRSTTFAGLVDRLQTRDVVVYVSVVPQLPAALRGRSAMVAAGSHQRFVWSEIATVANRDETIALVGHELQHALEIAEAQEVIDQASMERLYRRIGTPDGPDTFETERAIETEWRVRKELCTNAAGRCE